MAPNSKLIQSKWTVRGRLICWSCCLDECCRGRGWLGTEACVALPTAWGYEAGIFFFLLFSRPGPDLWQHQLFLRWQVRGRVATWGWHPLRRWKWGPSDLGQMFLFGLMGRSEREADEDSEYCACMKRELRTKKKHPTTTASFSITRPALCVSLCFIHKLNSTPKSSSCI